MEEILSIKNLSKSYKNNIALRNVNLNIPSGRIIGLLGPNGSGKTTLIKLINGLLSMDSGEIKVCGEQIGVNTKKLVAYLPDKDFLFDYMTVDQMITYMADFFEDFRKDRAYDMVTRLGLKLKDRIKTLSKGTKEKVCLILTMSRDAKLYLLDEPIAGVDPATRDYIINTILSNYCENSSIIISTHLIYDIENALSDVIFLNRGNIQLFDSVDNIRENQGKSVDQLFREVFRC